MRTYICVYFGAAYLALVVTPLVIWLARRIGAVDKPGVRSIHTRPVPRIGGIAIYLSSVCLIVSLLFLNNGIGDHFRAVWLQVVTLLAAATVIFLVGLIDDLRRLPARVKFMAELLAAAGLCLVGVRIDSLGLVGGSAVSLGLLSWPLTLLWIVGVTNAVNMSDGLDGLAAGVAAITCGVIAVFAIHGSTIHAGLAQSNDIMMALFALALLGGLSGFLFFNFNPAKVFMGDCGSLFIGFTIASSSVMCVTKSETLVGLALPALALGIPIFDTLFSMLRRYLERRSLFAPDRSHFHHRLLQLGLNQRRAVMIIYIATLLAAGIGLCMLISDSVSVLIVFGGVLLLVLLLFRAVGVVRLHEVLKSLKANHECARQERDERRAFESLELQFRDIHNTSQWWKAVCEAASRMDFVWVSLKTTHEDGRIDTEVWRASGDTPPDASRLVMMTIPFKNGNPHTSEEFEIAVSVNGSLEAAGRRVTLFGRLIDEYGSKIVPGDSGAAGIGMDR